MSILPQELMRKNSAESRESSKPISSSDTHKQRFRELMQVSPVEDRPREKNIFSLLEEEEDDDDQVREAMGPAGQVSSPILPSNSSSEQEMQAVPYIPPSQSFSSGASSSASVITPYTTLTADVEALYERMASAMIVMCSSRETETTLFLDNPHFASSQFFGSKITIREFSTAPKAFNIEIASTPNAIACLEAGKQDLLSAFQNGRFNFSVNRIDTHVQSEERPVLHRKESSDHDQQERQGGRE